MELEKIKQPETKPELEVVQPQIANIREIDALISASLNYPKGGHFCLDFPRMFQPGNLENCLIAKDASGKIVAHVGAIPMVWQFNGKTNIDLLVIGGVATDPDFRGQGIASRLITQITEENKTDYDYALLWGEKESFYNKLGFFTAGKEVLAILPEGFSFPPLPEGYQVVTGSQLGPEKMNHFYSGEPTNIKRNRDDWVQILKIPNAKIRILLDERNTPVSYVATGKGQDFPGVIHEWQGDPKNLMPLLGYAMENDGAKMVLGPTVTHPLFQKLGEQGVGFHEKSGGMWLPLNQKSLEEKLRSAPKEDVMDLSQVPIPIWFWGFDSH